MSESWRKFINTRVSAVNSPFVEQLYHIPCYSGTHDPNGQPRYLTIVTYLMCLPFIFLEVFHHVWGLLDKLADRMYCRVMCIVVFIILREPEGCRSQQQWGICWSTWSSFCAVRAFRVLIKHQGFVQSAYLSDNPYAWLTLSGSTGLLIFSISLVCIC
jgi:hypothetical protein